MTLSLCLTCEMCGRDAHVRIDETNLCTGCAHSAIDAARPTAPKLRTDADIDRDVLGALKTGAGRAYGFRDLLDHVRGPMSRLGASVDRLRASGCIQRDRGGRFILTPIAAAFAP